MSYGTAESRKLLGAHASVQDLDIKFGGTNLAKSHLHKMLISSGPLHEFSPSEVGQLRKKAMGKGAYPEAAGQRVTVIKSNAPGGGRVGSEVNASPSKHSFTASQRALNDSLPPLSSPSKKNTFTTSSVVNHAKKAPKVVTVLPPRQPPSLVSTVFSYSDEGCSHAESFSMYSCSCCHVKPPSSVASAATSASLAHLSAYENMTSVSQRKANNPSVTSSVIEDLREELESERMQRLETQKMLADIKSKQEYLIQKLSPTERANLEKMMAEPSEVGSRVSAKHTPEQIQQPQSPNDVNANTRRFVNKRTLLKRKDKAPSVGPFSLADGDSSVLA